VLLCSQTVDAATTKTDENGNKTIELESSDFVFKDEAGNIVSIKETIQYAYVYNTEYKPKFTIYYNDEVVGYTYSNYSVNSKFSFSINYKWYNPKTAVYEQTYSTNKAGKYQVIISMSDYKESKYSDDELKYLNTTYHLVSDICISYEIMQKNINDTDIIVSVDEDDDYVEYTGNKVYCDIKISASYKNYLGMIDNKSLQTCYIYDEEKTVDEQYYDCVVRYTNNIMPGTATITMTGVGNYTGTRTYTFAIKADIDDCDFNKIENYQYTGKSIVPDVTASLENEDLASVYKLVKDTDYTVEYANNLKHGEASVTINGIGNYYGTYTINFGIVPKKVTKIKISSPKENQAKITWKTSTGAQGYQIERYNSKKKEYEVIGILTGQKWQVFFDGASSLKHNKKYKYRITPFVISENDYDTYYFGNGAVKSGKVTKSYKELNIPILTGDANVDYAAEVICKKVIKKGMSSQQKVKALYDWVVNNCKHDKNYSKHKKVYKYSKNKKKAQKYATKMWKKIYAGKIECTYDGGTNESGYSYRNDTMTVGDMDGYYQFYRAQDCFETHKGGCSYITRLFKVLVNHVGIDCTLADGNFVNRDGTKMYHVWCYIRTNKKYAWYDVDVATSNKNIRYHWYKRNTAFWKSCHEWNQNSIPRGVPKELKH